MRWFKKLQFLIVGIAVFVCISACSKSIEQQIVEQMELGQKYLTELDYEKAIIAFEKAIEIDPKAFDAYAGLAQVYAGQKEYDKAADILERGQVVYAGLGETEHTENVNSSYEILRNVALNILRPLAEQTESEAEYEHALRYYEFLFLFDDTDQEIITTRIHEKIEKIEFSRGINEQISLMKDYSEKEVDELIESLDIELIKRMIGKGNRFILTENGMGIGFYKLTKGRYCAYFGDYVNGIREGKGIWVLLNDNRFKTIGVWENDYPNGHQIQYSFEKIVHTYQVGQEKKVEKYEGMQIREGNVVNGIWEGEAVENKVDGSVCDVYFANGRYVNDEHDKRNTEHVHTILGFD